MKTSHFLYVILLEPCLAELEKGTPTNTRQLPQFLVPRAPQTSMQSTLQTISSPIPATAALSYSACSWIGAVFSYCSSSFSVSATSSALERSSCICSGGTASNTDRFNSQAARCTEYLTTAAPSLFSSWSTLGSLCGVPSTTSSGNEESTVSIKELNAHPGPTSLNPNGDTGIKDFTKSQRVGILIGCGIFGLLALAGIFVCIRKPKRRLSNEEAKHSKSNIGKTTRHSSLENGLGRSPEVSQTGYMTAGRATL